MIVTADADAAEALLHRPGTSTGDVHLVTTPEDLERLRGVGLGRRDRVLWLDGWSDGAAGRALAARAETAAATGAFGAARHGFAPPA